MERHVSLLSDRRDPRSIRFERYAGADLADRPQVESDRDCCALLKGAAFLEGSMVRRSASSFFFAIRSCVLALHPYGLAADTTCLSALRASPRTRLLSTCAGIL